MCMRVETCVLPSDRPLRETCRFDVLGDLTDEILLAVERALVAQPLPELDDQSLAVQVAVEVDQVRLDSPFGAAVMRIDADRDGSAVAARRACVDPVRGNEQVGRDVEIRRRIPECPTAL